MEAGGRIVTWPYVTEERRLALLALCRQMDDAYTRRFHPKPTKGTKP